MSINKFFRCLLAIILLLVTGCHERATDLEQVSYEDRIVIKFSHVVAESTPKGQAANRFAALVKERTGGRVEVQVYPNSVLYKDGEEMEALSKGQVQMIAPATAKVAERYPLWQIFDLPFLFFSEEEVHRVMDGEVGRQLFQMLEQHRVKAIAMWDNGFKQITTTVPLRQLEDFKGIKFRVMPGSGVREGQFRRLGAETVPLGFNEVYKALEEGMVQGTENSASNIYSKKFYELQPYLTISNHGYLGYVVLVNASFWDSLPEDIKVIIEETMEEVTHWQREVATKQNAADLEAILKTGKVEAWWLTPEEKERWRQMMMPVYRDFENLGGSRLLASARRELELEY
ncbi:MAG: TRAP transporter substrate-binding protein [Clostridia bacterium]|nr:TRAP transporter substrate-binding protein [Clostridia bacterium]